MAYGGYDLYGDAPYSRGYEPVDYTLASPTDNFQMDQFMRDPYGYNYDPSFGSTPAGYDWAGFGKRAAAGFAKQSGGEIGEEDKGPGFGPLGRLLQLGGSHRARISMDDLMQGLTTPANRMNAIDPGNLQGGLTARQPYQQLIPTNQQQILRIMGLVR